MDDSNDARAPLLVELAWSGELLKCMPAWGGNLLRRAREGRWISELHSLYPAGSAGHPAGLYAGELLFGSHQKSGENGEGGDGGVAEGCDSCPLSVWPRVNRGRTVGAWLVSGLV